MSLHTSRWDHPRPWLAYSQDPLLVSSHTCSLASLMPRTRCGDGNSACLTLRIAVCSSTTNSLVSLDRENPVLQQVDGDCAIVCNPQPQNPLFPYSTQGGYGSCSNTLLQELTSLCCPEQLQHCSWRGPAHDGCAGAELPGPQHKKVAARW